MQINKILQYVFYGLLCLPVLVMGCWFFVSLVRDIKHINMASKKAKEEKIKARNEQVLEAEKKRIFYEQLDRKRNG